MTPSTIPEAAWHALGWAMLHFLWIGTVVSVLFLDIERLLLRRSSPQVRYTHGLLCLAALAATAGLCVWHQWPTPAPMASTPTPMPAAESVEGAMAPAASVPPSVSDPNPVAHRADHATPAAPAIEFHWVALLPWLWLCGSAVFATILVLGLAGAWRLRRSADLTRASAIQLRCDELRSRLGISRQVVAAVSKRVKTPLMVGVVRPLIILPTSALSGMSPSMVEWILLHELAHVRRWDNAVILFQRVAECLLFFHPCVWLTSRWIDREREFCCDEFALNKNKGADPAGYAAALATLAGVPQTSFAPASAMAKHAVVRRIGRVLGNDPAAGRSGGVAAGVLMIAVIVAFTLIAMTVGQSQADTEQAEPPPAEEAAKDHYEKARREMRKSLLEKVDEVWKKGEAAPAPQPAEADAPDADGSPPMEIAEPAPPAPAPELATAPAVLVAHSYRVPPDFVHQFDPKGVGLQKRLASFGVESPEGSFAFYDPVLSTLVVKNTKPALALVEKQVEPMISNPRPQVYLNSKIKWAGGGKENLVSAPSVVTRSGQRAKVEIIRELIVPSEEEKGKFEMVPLGLQWETEPVVDEKGPQISMKGEVLIRTLKGEDMMNYVGDIAPLKPAQSDDRPEFDVYRVPFDQVFKPGETVEFALGETPARRALLKRHRRPAGKITAMLTANLIDAKGEPIKTERELRDAFPDFKLRLWVPQPRQLAAGARSYSVALAAYDLGDYAVSQSCARTALAYEPDNAERLSAWNTANAAMTNKKRRPKTKPDAWTDRSYRLRTPLMPDNCATDRGALKKFLRECGMNLPTGATANIDDDGFTLVVHNRGREIEKLETALANRLALHAGGAVIVDVRVVEGASRLSALVPFDPPEGVVKAKQPDSNFDIAGVFTDPQFQVVRREAEKNGKVITLPERTIPRGQSIDILKGSPLDGWTCNVSTTVGRDRSTIEAVLAPEQIETETDKQGKKIVSSRKSTTGITIWDGQWIALGRSNGDGADDLVFIRFRVADL